jgi:hypothetical protein
MLNRGAGVKALPQSEADGEPIDFHADDGHRDPRWVTEVNRLRDECAVRSNRADRGRGLLEWPDLGGRPASPVVEIYSKLLTDGSRLDRQ